jgi:hypothetical protein
MGRACGILLLRKPKAIDAIEYKEAEINLCVSIGLGTASCRDVAVRSTDSEEKRERPRWRSWLRHCTTSRKVAGSIPYGVIGIFHWHNSVVDV